MEKLTDLCEEVQNANFEDPKQMAEILVLVNSHNVSELVKSIEKMTDMENDQKTEKEPAAQVCEAKKVRVGIIGCGKAVMDATIATVSSCAAKGSLADFAEHLIELSTKEIQQLAQILEDEYGIVPAKLTLERLPRAEYSAKLQTKPRKQDYYVPKKLGKINSKAKR